jgi:copper chaperone CopZ
MRKLFAIAIMVMVTLAVSAQDKEKNLETVKFKTSIDCQACVNKIMSNLPQEKGIKDVKCDLKTKEVTVAYNKEKNTPEEIRKSLEKLGYTAKEVKPETEQTKK